MSSASAPTIVVLLALASLASCSAGDPTASQEPNAYGDDLSQLEARLATDPSACVDYIDLCDRAKQVCLDAPAPYAARCSEITGRCTANIGEYCSDVAPPSADTGAPPPPADAGAPPPADTGAPPPPADTGAPPPPADTGAPPPPDATADTAVPSGVPGTVIKDSVSGKVWPASHGEALISLWQDDKLGAISFTIDVASKADHAWWIDQGNTFGLRFTWFLVSSQVSSGGGYATWSDFASLLAMGHDVQSHTVTHLDGSLTIDQEYKDSRAAIEANLPGHQVLTLAYPGGNGSAMNDVNVASQYYVGARGTTGKHNEADKINYMRTNSLSAKWNFDPSHWASLTNIVTFNAGRPTSYRAWQCMHFHSMGTQVRADSIAGFKWVQAHAADLWPGLFREVILYGQERDAATLKVTSVTADRIVLLLTDTLADQTFDYPLTLKVGLANSWSAASAQQGGKPVPVKIVQHAGKPFALIQAVPDRGPVTLDRK